MALIAKMECTQVTEKALGSTTDGERDKQVEAVWTAVISGGDDDPNKEWSKWTPAGELTMLITNPEAFRQIETGQEYYVEIRKVQPAKARTKA